VEDNRYVIITPYFPSEDSHMGSYVYDQAKAINNTQEYNVRVVKVVSFLSKERDYTFQEFDVMVFKVFDFPFFIFPGIFNFINTSRIKRFFKSHNLLSNLDVIHTHVCYPAAYLANAIESVVKVKTISQHHGIDALQLLNGRFRLLTKLQNRFLKNRSIKQLNKIGLSVSVSKRVRKALHQYKKYQPKDEYVLYNGVDRTKFYNTNTAKNNEKYTIGCIANFWEIKDHISLIKAIDLIVLEGITNIELKLIGSGEKLDLCKQFVVDHNLSSYILFEKERPHTLINDFYNEIDLFVVPSYYEALGCVFLEAWATDTPILSIKEQGIAELIPTNEIDNLLADKKSPESLKEKILGEYNRKRSYPFDEDYDIRNTIRKFINYSFFKSDD
jgi:glycosyltransferase involved in cell wall biosynthesis